MKELPTYILVSWLLTISLMYVSCIKVLSIEAGVNMKESISYNGSLDASSHLLSLTVCIRVKILLLRLKAVILSLKEIDTGVTGIWTELVMNTFRVGFGGNAYVKEVKMDMEICRWHHLCFTYEHEEQVLAIYVDGDVVDVLHYASEHPVYGNIARLSSNMPFYNFVGELSQVNVWNETFSKEKIQQLAKCQLDLQGNYINWEEDWVTSGTLNWQDVVLGHFCQDLTPADYFVFPNVVKETAVYVCNSLRFRLPLPTTFEEVEGIFRALNDRWPEMEMEDFWTPISDKEEEGVWVDYHGDRVPSIPWKTEQPNGDITQNCAMVGRRGYGDLECEDSKVSAICAVTKPLQDLRFLGTCEENEHNKKFKVYQERIGELTFKAYGSYRIARVGGEWRWVDVDKNATMARLNSSAPMGRRSWRLERPVCSQEPGQTKLLLLTSCPQNHFTCDDGSCVPFHEHCDLKYDCLDRSDENRCSIYAVPEYYKRASPPRQVGKGASGLPIILEIIINFVDVDTTAMTLEASFDLKLEWHDNRLKFYNLQEQIGLNKLGEEAFEELWMPTVSVVNTRHVWRTKNDEAATLLVQRKQKETFEDNIFASEVHVYQGKSNTLSLYRKYNTRFECNFMLLMYPFDKQCCELRFQMESASKNFLTFDENNSRVEYTGNSQLVEYKVGTVSLKHDTLREFSEIKVQFPLEREAGYALLNIYIPSIIMMVVSYATLFFKPDFFEVRIMASLTTQLVVVTLFTQVSSALPRTSYFKMVDIWLLFCISVIFLIIISHMIIDSMVEIDNGSGNVVKVVPGTPNQQLGTIKTQPNQRQPRNNPKLRRVVIMIRLVLVALWIVFNIVYWVIIYIS